MLQARGDIELHGTIVVGRILGVIDGFRHFNIQAAHGVHQLFKPGKVDPDIVMYRDSQSVPHRLFRQRGPAPRIVLIVAYKVCGVDAVLAKAGDGGPEITRNRQH